MGPMPPKAIWRKACSHAKGPLGLSRDLGPKKHPNI